MTMGPALRDALTAVGRAMAGAAEPWWIIGSAAAMLHGVDAGNVRDVDVLIGKRDAARLLPLLGLPSVPGKSDGRFRSAAFARWEASAMPVEFMAGLRYRQGDAWRPLRPATRRRIVLDDAVLFVPSRDELREIFLAFGRDKDVARARLLDGTVLE